LIGLFLILLCLPVLLFYSSYLIMGWFSCFICSLFYIINIILYKLYYMHYIINIILYKLYYMHYIINITLYALYYINLWYWW